MTGGEATVVEVVFRFDMAGALLMLLTGVIAGAGIVAGAWAAGHLMQWWGDAPTEPSVALRPADDFARDTTLPDASRQSAGPARRPIRRSPYSSSRNH